MAQASLSPQNTGHKPGVPSAVTSKLQALRFKINTWLLIDGLSRVLIVAAGLLFLWFILDYLFTFDVYFRLVNLCVSCILLGYLVYQYLILPFSSSVSDDALVLAVEKHFGRDMGESLISAVQFSRMTNEIEIQGVSPELVRATIEQGTQAADKATFGQVVDKRLLYINLCILALAGVLLGVYAYGASAFRDEKFADTTVPENQFQIGTKSYSKQLLGIAFDREVLLKDTPWPQDIYFIFNIPSEGKQMIVPRGDDFLLKVFIGEDSKFTADEINDSDEVWINVVSPSGRFSEQLAFVPAKRPAREDEVADGDTMAEVAASASDEPAYFFFEMKNVKEEFQFEVKAAHKRGRTDWFDVTLVDRPSVEELSLAARLPEYTGGEVLEIPKGAGPHHILAGSTLMVKGTANKPLSAVQISGGEKSEKIALDGVKKFAHEIEIGRDFQGNNVRIELWDNEELLLAGRDEPGPLNSRRPTQFSIRVKADRPPDVVAKLNSISGIVTPNAIIPFDCLIKDEFAVTEAKLNYEWKHEEEEAENGKGDYDIASAKEQLNQPLVRLRDEAFELSDLQIPLGSGLRFFITAKDNDAINPEGPNEGSSTVFLLRVVSEAEVRDAIIRKQAEIRVEFERQYKLQQDLITETEVLKAASRDEKSMTAQQRKKLLELQKDQKLLETNVGNVAKRMEDIAQEMRNNRLDENESTLMQKLQDNVIQPMKELAQGDIDKAMRELDKVRANADQPQPREDALDKAIDQQQKNENKMADILKNMAKTEGYQEAVNLFYEIVKEQERLEKMTEEERQKLIQDILEGGNKDKE